MYYQWRQINDILQIITYSERIIRMGDHKDIHQFPDQYRFWTWHLTWRYSVLILEAFCWLPLEQRLSCWDEHHLNQSKLFHQCHRYMAQWFSMSSICFNHDLDILYYRSTLSLQQYSFNELNIRGLWLVQNKSSIEVEYWAFVKIFNSNLIGQQRNKCSK